MPMCNLSVVAILPAEDVGKTHIAISAVGVDNKAVEESFISYCYLMKDYRGRYNFYALRVHSIAGYMPL